MHRVCRLIIFVRYAVCTKWSMAVLFVQQAMMENDFTRAVVRRDAIDGGEVVESHGDKMNHVKSICCGRQGYGSVHARPRACSLTTQILLSISPTCSLAAGRLRASIGTWSFNFSNLLSMRTVWTVQPALAYTQTIRCMRSPCFVAVRFGACSIVIKFIVRETETKNGTELTNITSTASVTCLLTSASVLGISVNPHKRTILLCVWGSPYANFLAIPARSHTGISVCVR